MPNELTPTQIADRLELLTYCGLDQCYNGLITQAVSIIRKVAVGELIELPTWPIPVNQKIRNYRIIAANSIEHTVTLKYEKAGEGN